MATNEITFEFPAENVDMNPVITLDGDLSVAHHAHEVPVTFCYRWIIVDSDGCVPVRTIIPALAAAYYLAHKVSHAAGAWVPRASLVVASIRAGLMDSLPMLTVRENAINHDIKVTVRAANADLAIATVSARGMAAPVLGATLHHTEYRMAINAAHVETFYVAALAILVNHGSTLSRFRRFDALSNTRAGTPGRLACVTAGDSLASTQPQLQAMSRVAGQESVAPISIKTAVGVASSIAAGAFVAMTGYDSAAALVPASTQSLEYLRSILLMAYIVNLFDHRLGIRCDVAAVDRVIVRSTDTYQLDIKAAAFTSAEIIMREKQPAIGILAELCLAVVPENVPDRIRQHATDLRTADTEMRAHVSTLMMSAVASRSWASARDALGGGSLTIDAE
jgi:hypothetical protein